MSSQPAPSPATGRRVAVLGAGIAGLAAARVLTDAGHQVTVLDKARSVGGRLATRRLDDAGAVADHGAQFFTVRSTEMAELRDRLERDGLLVEWNHGFGDPPDGHPRYAIAGGMNQLAKWMAEPLADVRCGWMATSVSYTPDGVVQITGDNSTGAEESLTLDAAVITSPLPQTLALLDAEVISNDERRLLESVSYDPTLAILASCSAPLELGASGARRFDTGALSIVVDNSSKGVGSSPSLTAHASSDWSRAHWDDPDTDALMELVALVDAELGTSLLVEPQLKRWRYATPVSTLSDRFMALEHHGGGAIVLAGDAFGGPKIEGAYLSGLAAGRYLRGTSD